MMRASSPLLLILALAAACQNPSGPAEVENPPSPEDSSAAKGQSFSFSVSPVAETEAILSVSDEDAADDPAIYVHPQSPSQSLIYGSNKKYGVETYNLAGKRLADYPFGRINNVDILYRPVSEGDTAAGFPALLGGSNRSYNGVDLWPVYPELRSLERLNDTLHSQSALGEVYGFCFYASADAQYVFVNGKSGKVEQYRLSFQNDSVHLQLKRKLDAGSQTEGMVADTVNDFLYLGVEEGGILVYYAHPDSSAEPLRRIALSGDDNPDLAYDIEGLTLYYGEHYGREGYLLASSQGNNRFAVFRREAPNKYLGYFTIEAGNGIDGVSETDGIDLAGDSLSARFPAGVFIAQDGFNTNPQGDTLPQNFKLVSWQQVLNKIERP